jgi:hypothetical protein
MTLINNDSYLEFEAFIKGLNQTNWGLWPESSTWPSLGIGYTLSQFSNGGQHADGSIVAATVVKFEKVVQFTDGRKGNSFYVGNKSCAPKKASLL